MRWKGFLSVGVLAIAVLGTRAADLPGEMKSEIDQLRRERDVAEARLRIANEQLDEERRAHTGARLEIEGLEFRNRQLQEEIRKLRTLQPQVMVLPEANPITEPMKSKFVRGKVTSLSRDLRFMQISVGTTIGAKEGQVLDVFRMESETGKIMPLYLGTLRVTQANPKTAIGEFERVRGLGNAPRIGDDVSNELTVK